MLKVVIVLSLAIAAVFLLRSKRPEVPQADVEPIIKTETPVVRPTKPVLETQAKLPVTPVPKVEEAKKESVEVAKTMPSPENETREHQMRRPIRKNPQEILKERDNFLRKELSLTDDQIDQFNQILNEISLKISKVMMKSRDPSAIQPFVMERNQAINQMLGDEGHRKYLEFERSRFEAAFPQLKRPPKKE